MINCKKDRTQQELEDEQAKDWSFQPDTTKY